ncbi:unnamed protein product, partial [Brassica oleracea var. botrytis]
RVPLPRVVAGQESEVRGSLSGYCSSGLMNDNRVFRWVDEAFKYEMQHLDYQVRVLEEELQLLKAT